MSAHDQRDDYDDEPWKRRRSPDSLVAWSAAIMWVFGVFQFILAQFGLVFVVTMFVLDCVNDKLTLAEEWQTTDGDLKWLVPLGWPLSSAAAIVVVIAANNLRHYRRYPLVIAGSIITFLAIPCFWVGVIQLPLGIWLLVLLLRRDVRARFESVARGTIPPSSQEPADARIDRTPGTR